MAVEKKLLKRLHVLYVEDDSNVRNELSVLLSNFFANVYTASDGKEGLELYVKHRDKIDLIITDINMPVLNGINMMKKIREVNKKVNVIFATAYSDTEFLMDAISLKVYDYIVKPIDVRALLVTINELAVNINNRHLIEEKNKELEHYKEITDSNNIVIKTDTQMKITYVNSEFCEVTGYDENELIGEDFTAIKHKDTDLNIFKEVYSTVLDNNQWQGKIKNIKKDGSEYNVDMFMMATHNDQGKINGAIAVLRDITNELTQKRDVQSALMKDKSQIFIKSKDASAEYTMRINQLLDELENSNEAASAARIEKDKYVYAIEKFKVENQKLKGELAHYKKDSNLLEDNSSLTLKTNKENQDLRLEIKRLNLENEQLEEDIERKVTQARVTLEIQMDDLEKELQAYKSKLDSIEDGDILTQKIEYWKEKADNEAKRVKELEQKITQTGDKPLMQKLFGN